MMFNDRQDAGKRLAKKLSAYKNQDVAVFALPRGGVPVAREISKYLNTPLNLIFSRKIGHPQNSEFAICAVTETGPLICDRAETKNIDPEWLSRAENKEREEAARRRTKYMPKNTGFKNLHGKKVIIVDDGIATGLTVTAAIGELRTKNPEVIIVAVPVLPNDIKSLLASRVNEVVSVLAPENYLGSVGAYYRSFPQVTDDEVVNIIKASKT